MQLTDLINELIGQEMNARLRKRSGGALRNDQCALWRIQKAVEVLNSVLRTAVREKILINGGGHGNMTHTQGNGAGEITREFSKIRRSRTGDV